MNRIDLRPSLFDRLDPVARAVRWWTSQMTDMFGAARRYPVSSDHVTTNEKSLPSRVTITLPATQGFGAITTLPKGQSAAHHQALDIRLRDVAPVDPAQLEAAATAIAQSEDGATTYAVVMGRREHLDRLDADARKAGARDIRFKVEGFTAPEFEAPAAKRRAKVRLGADAGLVILIAVAAAGAVMLWTNRVADETDQLAASERSLRVAAVSAEATRKESDLSRQLVERGIFNRRASSALLALAELNTATPDNAWWRRIVWTPGEVTISAQGANATASLNAMSAAAKGWSIELSGSLAAAPQGTAQAFELVARPRKVAP